MCKHCNAKISCSNTSMLKFYKYIKAIIIIFQTVKVMFPGQQTLNANTATNSIPAMELLLKSGFSSDCPPLCAITRAYMRTYTVKRTSPLFAIMH